MHLDSTEEFSIDDIPDILSVNEVNTSTGSPKK